MREFFDLSIPHSSADSLSGEDFARVREVFAALLANGFSFGALDYAARLPLRPKDLCRLPLAPLRAALPTVDGAADCTAVIAGRLAGSGRVVLRRRDARALVGSVAGRKRARADGAIGDDNGAPNARPRSMRVLTRITVTLEPTVVGVGGNGGSAGGGPRPSRVTAALQDPLLSSWDVVAVEPADAEGLAAAIASGVVDIFVLDMSAGRLPFTLRAADVDAALRSGGAFELKYAPAIRDASMRRAFFATAAALLRLTRGRGVVLSSAARDGLEIRGPRDAASIAAIAGLSTEAAFDAMSATAAGVVARAQLRKRGGVQLL